MHGQHVPAVGAEHLRDVEVLFEAGKAVEDNGCGMRAFACSKVENAEEHAAVTWKNHLFRRSWLGSRSRSGLSPGRSGKHGRETDEAHKFHRRSIYALAPVCLV